MTNFGKFATFGQQVYHYHTTLKIIKRYSKQINLNQMWNISCP